MITNIKSRTKNGRNATETLADINAQIEQLKQRRVALAEPLKTHYTELRGQLADLEREIKVLDESWKPQSKPKADARIVEILTAKGEPMTEAEIVQALTGVFSPWKTKNVLKKRSTGPKAVFTLADGKYSVRAAA